MVLIIIQQEALNMYFQTGSVVGRSLTQDGELNRGKVPVQELTSVDLVKRKYKV